MNNGAGKAVEKKRHDYYTNQMNIVLFVDVKKILRTGSVNDAVWLFDNVGSSRGCGSTELTSLCKPGTVINWLVYALDMERRADGTWPPVPYISNIVFLDADDGNTSRITPFEELKIFGGPDNVRSMYTPAYSYWAGNIRMEIPDGKYYYPYRLVIRIEDRTTGNLRCFNVDGASLEIVFADGKNDGLLG